jgi:ABC-type uncharacterized transport system permease subunit
MEHLLVPLLNGTLVAATPLIYAAMGELVAERSGVLNLGIEGMMLIGTVTAFATIVAGYPAFVAALAAAGAGAASSAIFAVFALGLATNQYAAGLALTILGSGLSGFIGHRFGGSSAVSITRIHIPVLSEVPLVGPVLFNQDPMVYLALCVTAGVWWACGGFFIAPSPDWWCASSARRRSRRLRSGFRSFGSAISRRFSAGRWRVSVGRTFRSPTLLSGSRT